MARTLSRTLSQTLSLPRPESWGRLAFILGCAPPYQRSSQELAAALLLSKADPWPAPDTSSAKLVGANKRASDVFSPLELDDEWLAPLALQADARRADSQAQMSAADIISP